MGADIKGIGVQDLHYPTNGLWIQQDAPENGLFSFYVLGGEAIAIGLKIEILNHGTSWQSEQLSLP